MYSIPRWLPFDSGMPSPLSLQDYDVSTPQWEFYQKIRSAMQLASFPGHVGTRLQCSCV